MDSSSGIIRQTSSGKVLNFAKVFLYMFIGLLITGGVCAGLGALFTYTITDPVVRSNTLLGITIGASIVTIIVNMALMFAFVNKGKSALPLAIVYVVLVGVLLSSFSVYLPWQVLSGAFGVTAIIFGIMALIGVLTQKVNMNVMGLVGGMLIAGAGFVFLFTWIFSLFIPGFAFGVSLAYMMITFAAIMLITIYDVWRVGKICETGEMNTNLSLYCAITLYTDFIQIFIRVVYFLIINSRR